MDAPLEAGVAEPGARVEAGPGWLYPVGVLTVVYVLNFIDRQIVNILAEPIKKDLKLHDWQLGVLTGLAFAVVYAIVAVPIARLAERAHRPRLIAGGLTLWSLATMACAAAAGFAQLAAARVVVGLGESGYAPASHALITDTVPRRRRTLAFGVFNTALPVGGMLALAIGGVVADQWGWRRAFLLAGLPGLLMAAVAALTLREPRARRSGAGESRFLHDAGRLAAKPGFRWFWLAGGLMPMTTFGIQAFVGSFFFRNHGPEIGGFAQSVSQALGVHFGRGAVLGPALGVILGAAGIASALFSGALTDRLVARNPRFYSLTTSVPLILAAPMLALALTAPGLVPALTLLAAYFFLAGMAGAPWVACIQGLAGPGARSTASAISLLATVLMGNGLGPLLIGAVSDAAAATGLASGAALRLAMLVGILPSLAAAGCYLLGGRHLAHDLEG